MGRRLNSELGKVVEVPAALPWWASLIAAVPSYVLLHALARPPVVPSGTDAAKQLGPVPVHAVIAGAAVFGPYLVPILGLIAATLSIFQRRQGREFASRVATAPSAAALEAMSRQDFDVEGIDGVALHRMLRTVDTHSTPLEPATSASQTPETGVPACPVRGSGMVRRTARKGANAGKALWGCERYPGCRGTRPS